MSFYCKGVGGGSEGSGEESLRGSHRIMKSSYRFAFQLMDQIRLTVVIIQPVKLSGHLE